MEPRVYWLVTLAFFSLFLRSFEESSDASIKSLDSAIRDYAFDALVRQRTGTLYQVPLPSNLSGIEAAVLRVRSGSIWSNGANISTIHIPPRTTTVPFVRRLVIVYQDLGNWSAAYYNVPGYSLVAPVIIFLAYNATNTSSVSVSEVEFRVLGGTILITFPQVTLPDGLNSAIKCARYRPDGTVQLEDMISENVCPATTTGHFTIVVPSVIPGEIPAAAQASETRWRVWVIACACGIVGAVSVGLAGIGIFKLARNKKMEEMERKAEEGEALGSIWVGRSKMPSAGMTRTMPAIDSRIPP